MKTTKRKFSLGVKIASILSCVAVLSVGFASWLIVNIPQPESVSVGSFEVYEVVDNSVTLSYDWGANDTGEDTDASTAAKIIFGKPDADADGYVAPTNNWLQAGNDVQNEKLSAKVEVSISNFAELDSFKVTFAAPSAYTGLIGNTDATKYVTAPVVNIYKANGTTKITPTVSGNDYTIASTDLVADVTDGTVCTVIVEFVFGWGAAFNSTNPYLHYNNQEYSASLGSDASTKLGAINTALSTADLKYTVTFTCE